ncbi:MAG: RNA 2',3'-cyclic phosphodiesterase [Thermoanaerobaculia bacterium]
MSSVPGPERPLRLFVGWPVPDDIRREVGRVVATLRHDLPAASWAQPEKLHLTFAFLGATPAAAVGPLARELDALEGVASAEVAADRAGFFPGERRPKVAWIGLSPEERLVPIAEAARAAVARAGVAFDEKPFRPHLTLARIKAPWRRGDVERFRAAFAAWTPPPMTVDRIVLYESRLSSAGATHVPLREVPFGAR